MPDPFADDDFSQFVKAPAPLASQVQAPVAAPAPSVAPVGGDPFANEDFSAFTSSQRTQAPLAQRVEPQFAPKFNAFTAALTGQRVPEVQEPGTVPTDSQLLDEWKTTTAQADLGPHYPAAPSISFEAFKAKRLGQAPLAAAPAYPLGSQGMGGAFAADLTHGVSRLGSMWGRGQLAPDRALEDAYNADQALYEPRTFMEKAAGGVGGSVPLMLGVAATRGASLAAAPAIGAMAVPLEVGGASFVQGMADPNMTPQQNISSALIETLTTRAGGMIEPGFKTPMKRLPAEALKESAEEASAGFLGGVSSQVNDPSRVESGADLDWSQIGEETALGAVSGPMMTAGAQAVRAPFDSFKRGPAEPSAPGILDGVIDRLAADPAPEPEVAEVPSEDAIDWDDETLEGPETREDNLRNKLFDELTDEEAAAINAELENIENQAPEVEAPEVVPDEEVAAPARPRDIQDVTETQVDIGTPTAIDQNLAANEDAKDDVQDMEPKGYKGPAPKPAEPRGTFEDFVANETEEGNIAKADVRSFIKKNPTASGDEVASYSKERMDRRWAEAEARMKDFESQGSAKPAEVQESPEDRAWREESERRTAKGILAPRNLPSKFAQGGFVTKEQAAERAKAPKVSATAPTETNPEPVGPAQEGINFEQPAPTQESPSPVAEAAKPAVPVAPKGFPARGSLKGRRAERVFFGPALTEHPAPKGFESQPVHVVKDGGVTKMNVKDMGQGLYVAHHPNSGSAMILAKTDAKGRRDVNGTDLRPLNARGEVETVDVEAGKGLKFPSVEDAVRFAGRNLMKAEVDTKAAEDAGQEIGAATDTRAGGALNVRKGQNIGVTRRAPEPAAAPSETPVAQTAERSREFKKRRLADLADRGQRGNLSDEELDEADALEAELAQPATEPEPKAFKAVPGSPLTPRLRQDIADSVTPDMPARNVGMVVKNMLEAQLKRPATQTEVAAALRDLAENDIYGGGVAPGSSKEVHALNFMPLVKGLAKIAGVNPGGWLREKFAELSLDNQAFAEVQESIRPGQFGYTPRQIAKFVTRMVGMRGKVGSWLVNATTQLSHLMTARQVSAWFPEFRPILRLAQKMIDQSRIKFQENFERLRLFRAQRAESKFQINGALVQFRLENRDPKDFDKVVNYIDEQGRAHQFTLTPRQIGIVKLVHAAAKNALMDYVDVLKDVFKIPPSIVTVADLRKAIAADEISASAKILEAPMQILESGKDNYVPLKRYGNQYHAIIYDAAKFAAARTRAQRKAAEIGFIKATSNADLNEQIANAGQKHPGSHIVAYEDAMAVNGDKSAVSAKALQELADVAGVPPSILSDFLDAGVGSYLETRGIGARFAESKNVPGFSHDMLHGMASHLQAMTQATERLRYRSKMEQLTKDLKDHELKRYAQRFMEHIDVPVGALAQGVRAITTLYYLGLGAVSAAVNSFTSLVVQPAGLFMATGNPGDAAKAFGIAAREQFNALTAILGNGANPVGRVIGRGQDQIELAVQRARNQKNFRLAEAIESARDAGVFNNIFDREAESIAKHGEDSGLSKARDLISQGMMHFFSKVETANRLSAFIGGYGVHEQNSGSPGYDRYVNALGFSPGGSSAEFAEFFSDSNNFRGDPTDLPSWAHGKFVKDSSGKEVFAPSTWRPMAYALKSYTVNYLAQQLIILRAAMTGGWIDKALYAGIATSFIVAFGATNVFPGLSTLDKAVAAMEGGIETPLERIKDGGGIGRTLTTGLPGQLATEYLDERLGETIDYMASRAGSANVLPGGIKPTDLFAPLSVADAQARAISNLMSGDRETQLEGLGGLTSKQGERTARAYNQLTGTRGYTTKDGATLVPDESTAVPGAPYMTLGDIASSFLGAQPPVVRDAYREKQMIRDMKTSNDAVMENAVNDIADGVFAKDKAKIVRAVQSVNDWNARALNNKEPWKLISGDAIQQAAILEVQSRQLGARNLRQVPKFGRARYLQEFEDSTPDENIKKPKAAEVTEDEE